jgi:hypothetical protein
MFMTEKQKMLSDLALIRSGVSLAFKRETKPSFAMELDSLLSMIDSFVRRFEGEEVVVLSGENFRGCTVGEPGFFYSTSPDDSTFPKEKIQTEEV